MNNNEKDKNNNIINQNEEDYDFLDIGNLNINQEVDIKENPKKYIVDTKKKNLLKKNIEKNSIDILENQLKKNKKKKKITYEDIYLGNDMFFTAPKSYPRDFEKNNKYLLSFSNTFSMNSENNMARCFFVIVLMMFPQ